jgi:tRNA (cytidine56-2'-O)-methyltransferase
MDITVLRLGHRLPRDERITTHVALVARAFGATGIIYSGQQDSSLEKSVSSVANAWGGTFSISYEKNFISAIKRFKKNDFTIAHLTMYGMPLSEKMAEIRNGAKKNQKLLVIIGAERVPGEVYELADYNIAITSQPHSEVAALAIFLDRAMDGKELERGFDENFKGKIKLVPKEKGKEIKKTVS